MSHIAKKDGSHDSKKSVKRSKFSTLASALRSGMWENDALWKGTGQQMHVRR